MSIILSIVLALTSYYTHVKTDNLPPPCPTQSSTDPSCFNGSNGR